MRTLALVTSLLLAAAPTRAQSETAASADAVAARDAQVSDAALEGYRRELLEVAFRAASAFPLHPHVKSRSRAQEQVVEACFELDQPLRALTYAGGISNWRRGVGYASYAQYCAEHGAPDEVQRYLELALEVASADDQEQEWRRDRIRARVARTHLLLGQEEEASRVATNLEASELGILMAFRAEQATPETFEAELAKLDTSRTTFLAIGLDQVRNTLSALVRLYDTFYDDAERRARIETKIEGISWEAAPASVEIDFRVAQAEAALAHGDQARALEVVKQAQALRESVTWIPEDQVATMARLAGLRFRSGDRVRAKSDLDAALAFYDAHREEIQTMFRAGALRPLAEAYQAIGDSRMALTVYRNALEEGAINVNARPRCEDLVATCVSMALQRVEPDERLWERIRKVEAGLQEPW